MNKLDGRNLRSTKSQKLIIDAEVWEQKTFPYQVKCLDWIRDEFTNLEEDDKTKVLNFLTETGCEKLLKDKE